MNGQYYSLRWRGNGIRTDEHLAASDDTIRIGQRDDCEVRIPNLSQYADELFAVIKPARSADGWLVIPTSGFVRTFVNGSPVVLTHYLKSGDRISFSETTADILFEIRKGDNTGTTHFTSMSRRFIAIVSCTAAIVIALALYGLFIQPDLKHRNLVVLRSAEQSVFQLSVDSIYYVRTVFGKVDTLCRETSSGQSSLVINGSAFLTTDGMLVTARHCIEPWLNYNWVFLPQVNVDSLPLGTAWALKAETYNQTHLNDTSYKVVSKCTLRSEGKYLGTYWSSEFQYDNSRDEIVEIGDFSHRYFMRSITGRFNRSDMMLGDLAFMPVGFWAGTIEIPSEEILSKLVTTESSLTFKGYPLRQEAGLETLHGDVLKDYIPGHMISHSGNLESGYSGGPALAVYDGKAYAVGVISTFDKGSKHCCYSVPTSELIHFPAQ